MASDGYVMLPQLDVDTARSLVSWLRNRGVTPWILTPAELRELPQGRAVLFASGTSAVLTRAVPWWDGPHAPAITASITASIGVSS